MINNDFIEVLLQLKLGLWVCNFVSLADFCFVGGLCKMGKGKREKGVVGVTREKERGRERTSTYTPT